MRIGVAVALCRSRMMVWARVSRPLLAAEPQGSVARHSAKRKSEAKTQGRSSVVTGPAHFRVPGGTADQQASNASSRCSKVEQQKAEKNPADTPRQSSRQQRVRGG